MLSFVCVIRAAELSAPDLIISSRICALQVEARLCANEGVLVPHLRKLKDDNLKWSLPKIISDCEFDPVSLLLAFARASKTAWINLKAICWYV